MVLLPASCLFIDFLEMVMRKVVFPAIFGLFLTACGGGGGGGSAPVVVAQKTPSASELQSMLGVYFASIESQSQIIEFLQRMIPSSSGGNFSLINACPNGGSATLVYDDADSDVSVTRNDSYRITFNNCITSTNAKRYNSGSIDVSITFITPQMPNFSTGTGVFTTDWSVSETVTFNNLSVADVNTGDSSVMNGTASAGFENSLATSIYQSHLYASGLRGDSVASGVASSLNYDSLTFEFKLNSATQTYTLNHDFFATFTKSGSTLSMSYLNTPVLAGIFGAQPTAGSVLAEWSGYKQVIAQPQLDGVNLQFDIVGDDAGASLIQWSALGL